MTKASVLVVFSILLLTLSGCEKCRDDECPANLVFPFKVLGSNGKSYAGYTLNYQPYTSDSIQLSGLNRNGDWVNIGLRQDRAVLDYNVKEYRIIYSFAKDDTLSFEMDEYSEGCCKEIVTDYVLSINRIPKPVDNYDTTYIFIK